MCIICKQARRKALASPVPGAPPGPLMPAAPMSWRTATTTAATRAVGPRLRAGKRAYMRAVAQVVRGATVHAAKDIPPSWSWSPEEWEVQKGEDRSPAVATAAASDDSGSTTGGAINRGPDGQVLRSKVETWREQLRVCQATERQRIAFGKVRRPRVSSFGGRTRTR